MTSVVDIVLDTNTYQNKSQITSVDLANVPWVNNSMYNVFSFIYMENTTTATPARPIITCQQVIIPSQSTASMVLPIMETSLFINSRHSTII